ncbi:hypothetical protein [Kribbella sp. NPDC006257]|uniref:hypothetical protein n=1 Tax=Kribbella sp. NPDC006257 TaxID=3156738 RepID=UPI0033BACD7A
MTKQRRLISACASLGIAVLVFATGCDSDTVGSGHTPQPTASSPTAPPTALVKSAVTVTVRPPKTKLSIKQQQLASVFTEFINARYRFSSHPWIYDPVYLRTVLPGGPDNPTDTGSVGLVGPLTIQVLTIELSDPSTAVINFCADDRSVRYLGRDGSVDIAGPAGDHRRGDVSLQNSRFQLTRAAAADGKTSETPRWLAYRGGYFANAPECKELAASRPPKPPTPNTPTSG